MALLVYIYREECRVFKVFGVYKIVIYKLSEKRFDTHKTSTYIPSAVGADNSNLAAHLLAPIVKRGAKRGRKKSFLI